jgi:NADPH:quinone reductase-like Zn-dependent oxidoreductase
MYGSPSSRRDLAEHAGDRPQPGPDAVRDLPWWKSLSILNENKGVFGLNMLHWWDREGDLTRITGPLIEELDAGDLEPVVAEAFPFERAGDAHRFIAERRNIGKVVLVP